MSGLYKEWQCPAKTPGARAAGHRAEGLKRVHTFFCLEDSTESSTVLAGYIDRRMHMKRKNPAIHCRGDVFYSRQIMPSSSLDATETTLISGPITLWLFFPV